MVPETLEPSLQLASAVLSQLNMPQDEVAHAIQAFRRNHVSELQVTRPTLHSVCLSSSTVFLTATFAVIMVIQGGDCMSDKMKSCIPVVDTVH